MNLIPTLLSALPTTLAEGITPGGFFFNAGGSTYAANADRMVAITNWVNIICVVGIVATMVIFAVVFRQKNRNDAPRGSTHNTALELTWSIGPSIFLAFIFIVGFRDYMHMTETPTDTKVTVKVIAQKWSWKFQYENGYVNDEELIVPGGEPIKLHITSKDVIHSFFVPQFRMKKDAVPGRQNEMWFNAIYDPTDKQHTFTRTLKDPAARTEINFKVNIYDVFCAEYCGKNHSQMRGRVVVVDPKDYAIFMKLTNNIRRDPPALVGQKIYKANCASCHSVDGAPGTGPSWQGVWGKDEHIAGISGTVKVDYDYVRESIHTPAAKIVDGFQGRNMPAFTLTDDQVDAVIEYMKTLKPADANAKPLDWDGIDKQRDALKKK